MALTIRDVEKAFHAAFTRVKMTLCRGIVRRTDESKALQVLQGTFMAGETIDGEVLQQFGFSSRPMPGAACLAGFIFGSRDNPVIIASDDGRYRIALSEGEACIYGKDGQYIKMKDGGHVEASCVNLSATASGDVEVKGDNVTAEASTQAELKQGSASVKLVGGVATIEATSIKLGTAAVVAAAREGDPVYSAPGGSGSLVGYVFTTARMKVLTE